MMQLFNADAKTFLKQIFEFFFVPKNLWQLGGFFPCRPACPKQLRTSFPFYKFFYTIISARISGCYLSPQIKELLLHCVHLFKCHVCLRIIKLMYTHNSTFLRNNFSSLNRHHSFEVSIR